MTTEHIYTSQTCWFSLTH